MTQCALPGGVTTEITPPGLLVGMLITATPHVHAHPQGALLLLASLLPLLTISSLLPPRARLFHPAQPPRAYQSVHYAWPQTLTTSGSAAQKPSGTDPKPDVGKATKAGSSTLPAQPFAATGTAVKVVPPTCTSNATNALGAESRITVLRNVLEHRKNQALTPYKVNTWHSALHHCNLLTKYPKLLHSLHKGFDAGIRPIYITSTLANSPTLLQHPEAYQEVVSNEFHRGRYIGPCTRQEVESLIGPFQSSLLSWVPKANKPNKFRAIHNFSYPHSPTPTTTSINHHIDPDMFPCTWGTFATICFTIHNLPPGSQAAIHDVAEAYRTIPIIPDQWLGLVVKLLGEDTFAINTCNNFGLASAGGIYGELGDATLDIFRAHGIGPVSKWVDDHIFFRILSEHRQAYNAKWKTWHSIIMQNGGRSQSGGHFWYKGENLPNDLPADFDEDAAHPIVDFADLHNHSHLDSLFTYCDADIDLISGQLGIPWEPSKSIPFSSVVPLIGTCRIARSPSQRTKRPNIGWPSKIGCYVTPTRWEKSRSSMASSSMLVWCVQRGVLTSLVWRLSSAPSAQTPSFPTMPLDTPLPTFPGGSMNSTLQMCPATYQGQPLSSTQVPSPMPAQVLASALLSAVNGGPGVSSQAGRQTAGTSDGQKPLASNFSFALSAQQANLANTSGSLETTEELSKAGGKGGAGTGRQTRYSVASMTSQTLTSAFLSRATLPARKTQPTLPQGDFTLHLLASSQQSASQKLSTNLSSTSTTSPTMEPKSRSTSKLPLLAPASASPTNRTRHNAPPVDSPAPGLPSQLHHARPTAYHPNLSPHPSPLRPHCLARDRLKLWKPATSVHSRHSTSQEADSDRIFSVMSNAWADSTHESYSAGILAYHVHCDKKAIPEELRAPTSQPIITAFVASLAGSYSGSTISNYVHGIRAWHILHGLEWRLNPLEMDALLKGADRLAPPSSKRKKRQPYTPEFIAKLRLHLALDNPLDTAVFACLTTCSNVTPARYSRR